MVSSPRLVLFYIMSLNDLQSASSKKGSLFTIFENMSGTKRSWLDPTQRAAPVLDDGMKRKKTPMEVFRELKAESDRRKAQAAKEATHSALLDSSLSEHSTSTTLRRRRSRSPEASTKRARKEVKDIDSPELEEDEMDELSSVQRARLIVMKSCRYPQTKYYTCAVSVNGLPIIGSTGATTGYRIKACFDNTNVGLPGLRITFKSNKPGKLDESIASKDSDLEQFSVCYYPRHESGGHHRRMIHAINIEHFADGFKMDKLDRQIADACGSDNERKKLISVILFVNHDELTGELNRATWLVNHGDAIKRSVLQLLAAQPYHLRLWMFRSRKAVEAFGRCVS